MNKLNYGEILETCIKIVKQTQNVFSHTKYLKKEFSVKSCLADLVTESDRKIEKIIYDEIKNKFPGHLFIGEETSTNTVELTNEPTWMVDPIDGTTNFVHDFPFYCVSIALCHNMECVVGLIYHPFTNEMYYACKGRGAFCNDAPITVSKNGINASLILTNWGCDTSPSQLKIKANIMKDIISLPHGVHGFMIFIIASIRMIGSAAMSMCLVASGKADCYFEWGTYCWDIAAGAVIVREAGGIVCTLGSDKLDVMSRKYVCANSPDLIKKINDIVSLHNGGQIL